MIAMQRLPDLSECIANELTYGIGSAAEPCHSQVGSRRMVLPPTGMADLKGGLTLWLAGMKPEVMVKRYIRMRQLSVVEQQYREEDNQ